MRKFTKIAQDAFDSMQIEAGLLLSTLDTTGATAVEDADIICSTSGGIEITCKPSYLDFGEDIDNCPANTLECMEVDNWECAIKFTTNEANLDTIKLALGVVSVSGTKVTPGYEGIATAAQDIWWAGDRKDGGWVACCLKNALSTDGLSLKTTKKGKGQISCTLSGHVSIANPNAVPMEFYVAEPEAEGDE